MQARQQKSSFGQNLFRLAFELHSSSEFTIQVVSLSGKCYQLHGCHPDNTVSSLRERVAEKFAVTPCSVQLCKGSYLYTAADMDLTLHEAGVVASTVITGCLRPTYGSHCYGRIVAGWAKSERNFDFTHLTLKNDEFFALYENYHIPRAPRAPFPMPLAAEYVKAHFEEHLEKQVALIGHEPAALTRAFMSLDLEMKSVFTSAPFTGCTASCLKLVGNELHAAHVGNLRAVLFSDPLDSGGLATRLTASSDHKCTDPAEALRVIESGGTIFNDRVDGMTEFSRAFGLFCTKPHVSCTPSVASLKLERDDMFMILASSALWTVMDDQEAVNFAVETMRAAMAASKGQKLPRPTALVRDRPLCDHADMPESRLQSLAWMAEIMGRELVQEAVDRCADGGVTCAVVFFL